MNNELCLFKVGVQTLRRKYTGKQVDRAQHYSLLLPYWTHLQLCLTVSLTLTRRERKASDL